MAAFRRALLLYNPVSGGRTANREQTLAQVAEILRSAGGELAVEPTRGAGTAGDQARAAIERGCDTVFVCGGDGTVLDALQGIVHSQAVLGVLPLGTGNILAADLGLPRNTVEAARRLLSFEPRRIPVGHICCSGGSVSRYFSVAAGVGVHAELIYRCSAELKQTQGRAAYYLAGFKLFLRHEFVPFEVEITDVNGKCETRTVMELLAMRVRSFGGPLSRWPRGGALDAPYLQLVVLANCKRRAMFRYALNAIQGKARQTLGQDETVSFIHARHVVCRSLLSDTRIRVQADGDFLGTMPAELSIIPHALNLLMPVHY